MRESRAHRIETLSLFSRVLRSEDNTSYVVHEFDEHFEGNNTTGYQAGLADMWENVGMRKSVKEG